MCVYYNIYRYSTCKLSLSFLPHYNYTMIYCGLYKISKYLLKIVCVSNKLLKFIDMLEVFLILFYKEVPVTADNSFYLIRVDKISSVDINTSCFKRYKVKGTFMLEVIIVLSKSLFLRWYFCA